MLPTFVGLGSQRSASTWLHSVLKAHPQITMTSRKEANYFGYEIQWHNLNWYTDLFRDPSGFQRGRSVVTSPPGLAPAPPQCRVAKEDNPRSKGCPDHPRSDRTLLEPGDGRAELQKGRAGRPGADRADPAPRGPQAHEPL